MAMLLGGRIRFNTAALRSGEYPMSSSYPAHLRNRGKIERRTTTLTQGVQGYGWNHKKVCRIYYELELNLRVKPKKRLKRDKPEPLAVPDKAE
jgi:hypothetical protein